MPVLVEKFQEQQLSFDKRMAFFDAYSKQKIQKQELMSWYETLNFFPECDAFFIPEVSNYTPLTIETGLETFIKEFIRYQDILKIIRFSQGMTNVVYKHK